MKYRFVINKRLMGLNEYTKYNRTNKYAGAGAKKKEQQYIIYCIKQQLGNIKIDKPVVGHFTWIEENKRRDLDNICFAKKFILDALVQAEILQDDNRKIVTNFTDSFKYSNSSKVIVELEEIDNERNGKNEL
jgi:Holliday junction resolvase RusA-like endonuclease